LIFAQASFSPKTDFITGERPVSVCVGDLNGDGKPDVAVANYNSNTISIFLNTTVHGAAVPSLSSKTDCITGEHPISVCVCDLNGDGRPDIAVANYFSNTISIFLNTTSPGSTVPSFSERVDFITGERPISISICDLNGDGKPDLAVVNHKSNTVSVFLNTTSPGSDTLSFSARRDFKTEERPISIAIGDINGDGKPDLAVANYRSNTLSVFMNTTAQGDTIPSFLMRGGFKTGESPVSVSIGDLDGDGKPDLLVATLRHDTVSVFLNTTMQRAMVPLFSAAKNFTSGTNPQFVSIADLNDDGRLDFVVVNHYSNSVSVFLSAPGTAKASPSFSKRIDFMTGAAPSGISIGDINGDGRPDLTVVNYGANTISIFLNLTTHN
jgi:FG-GAP-like repeat/FG-GAP repeat